MAYIGRPLQVANLAVQSGTGDGSDTTPIATLDYATVTNGIAVYLDGVRQLAGTDFNVTAQTTLTFTTAPANGVGVDVYFLGLELSLPTPADGTVATAKIADDAVTLAKMASGTDGNIISYDASGNPVAIATGSDGQVLTSAGAGAPCAFETLTTGKVLQVVNTQTGAIITGTTLHVLDDTIPQKTEGFEVMTLAITPASASNKLKINVTVHTASSTASTLHITALFQDATANALAVGGVNMERTGDDIGTTSFTHYMAAGTTSETTFKVRTGTNGGATLSINGQVGNRLFGGVFISSITITEIAV